MRQCLLLAIIMVLISCNSEPNVKSEKAVKVTLKYAQGFSIEKQKDFKVITLHNSWRGDGSEKQYLLYKNKEPKGYDNAIKIKVPIKSIACFSLTHIAFIEALGLENTIVAASGINYTNSEKIKSLINTNKVVEIGEEQSINYEVLVDKKPAVVMAYGIDESSLKYINKLKQLGLKTILNAEYMETHPLGKAEWLKFIGAFYDMDEKADSLFDNIEKEYLNLVSLTKSIDTKPTVFVGMPWNGSWYVAGGKSFQAQLFNDAGANYLWKNNEEKSSVVKSKEVVYEEAFNADFWLNQNSYNSIFAVLTYDERLKSFKSVKDSTLFNNDNRKNDFGGNDYWESATVNPQIVLKDLIKIFHPELIEHELYYYRKMK